MNLPGDSSASDGSILRYSMLTFLFDRVSATSARHTDLHLRTQRDRRTARRLANTFEHDLELIDVIGFQFYVQDGVVNVYGTVRNVLDREMMLSLIRQVPGVQDIRSYLQVVNPAPQPEPAEPVLA